jgi:HK97 family phage portal protein
MALNFNPSFWKKRNDRRDVAQKGRVPFSLGSKYTSVQGVRSMLTFFGDNIEGYDSLVTDKVDYEAAVGRKTLNSIATACLTWVITSVNTCPIEIGREEDGQFIPIGSHPILDVVAQPFGTDYDWSYLMGAMLTDYFEFGNAYALKIPNRDGQTAELQYLKAENVRPIATDQTRLVSAYEYQPAGGQEIITFPADQIWHIRFPIPDPKDPSVGYSPLASVIRELYVDNLGSEVAAALMRKPRPSGILSPESSDIDVDQETLDALKRRADEMSSYNRSGSILGLSAGIKFTPISYSPKELALDEAKRKPEERICAVFQIPPSVVGMGAGLDRSTYSNMAEARLAAWEDSIAPLQDHIAASMMRCLFTPSDREQKLILRYDRSHVQVMVPDMVAIRQAARNDVMAGIITINEARAQQGLQDIDTMPFEQLGGQPIRGNIVMPAQNQVPDPQTLPASQQPVETRSLKRMGLSDSIIPRSADFLLGLERKLEADMAKILADIYDSIAILAEEIIGRGGQAGVLGIDAFRDVQARLTAVNERLAQLAIIASDSVIEAQKQAALQAIDEGAKLAEELQLLLDPTFGTQSNENYGSLLLMLGLIGFAFNGKPIGELFTDANTDLVAQVRSLATAYIAGDSTAEQLRENIAGLLAKYGNRINTIARTEMHQSSRRTTQELWKQSPEVTAFRRISARDERVCTICWALDGKLYRTAEMMPSHPNCRCRLVPIMKYENARDESGQAFEVLSEAEKQDILGPNFYEQYRQGARLETFIDYGFSPVWGTTVAPVTVARANAFADRMKPTNE